MAGLCGPGARCCWLDVLARWVLSRARKGLLASLVETSWATATFVLCVHRCASRPALVTHSSSVAAISMKVSPLPVSSLDACARTVSTAHRAGCSALSVTRAGGQACPGRASWSALSQLVFCACWTLPTGSPLRPCSPHAPACRATADLAARPPPRPCTRPRRRVLNQWVSRFDLWPYLERFTIDATKEILAEMGGKVGAARGVSQGACLRAAGAQRSWARRRARAASRAPPACCC